MKNFIFIILSICSLIDSKNQLKHKKSLYSPCKFHTTCTECTADPSCGWCNSQKCIEGTKFGPLISQECLKEWFFEECTEENCLIFSDCVSCTKGDQSCGYCPLLNLCISGDEDGVIFKSTAKIANFSLQTVKLGCKISWIYSSNSAKCIKTSDYLSFRRVKPQQNNKKIELLINE